ncbi:MAG: rod shape-determining protein RodA [Thermodesulfovibrionales bacterium]|nr:rod shape-determining protein RodA [Thermodesulfovibrionales bacterium]
MPKIDRRFFTTFDWFTFSLIILISIIGILTIYSATRPPIETTNHPDFYIKQIIWLSISILALLMTACFDYSLFKRFSYILYIIGIALLIIVLGLGKTTMGAQRWLNLGIFSFQPSEAFKLIFIIALSRYLSDLSPSPLRNIPLKGIIIFGIIPVLLIIKQPDLGTSILILSLFTILFLSKGVSKRIIVSVLIIGLISAPFLGDLAWNNLKDYQKNRIIAFLDPEVDPSGIGYHINQSKITIGSGNLFGKGYLKGTQGSLRFLPEKHTDFIFSVFAEEWGFIGCILLISLYLMLFLRGINTAILAKDEFAKLTAIGITTMFFLYFFVNIGMTLGMMPIVGVPLPFMSYGGTALLTNFIAAGILINIRMRRFQLFYP